MRSSLHISPRGLIVALSVSCMAQSYGAILVHSYNFGTGAVDLVGGSDGTLVGGANVLGGTLNLNGIDAFVDFSTALIPSSGSFSIDFSATSFGSLPGKYVEMISQGANCRCFYVGFNPAGNIRIGDLWTPSGIGVNPGQLTNYAVVSDSDANSTSLYIDAVLVATANFAVPSSGPYTRFGSQYGSGPGSGGSEFFNGSIQNVRIYSGALTPLEISMLVPEPPERYMFLLGLGALLTMRSSSRQAGKRLR